MCKNDHSAERGGAESREATHRLAEGIGKIERAGLAFGVQRLPKHLVLIPVRKPAGKQLTVGLPEPGVENLEVIPFEVGVAFR